MTSRDELFYKYYDKRKGFSLAAQRLRYKIGKRVPHRYKALAAQRAVKDRRGWKESSRELMMQKKRNKKIKRRRYSRRAR